MFIELFAGVGYVSRKAAMAVSPVACLTQEPDGRYCLSMRTPIRDVSLTFRLGEEMDEIRADGVKVRFFTFTSSCFIVQGGST